MAFSTTPIDAMNGCVGKMLVGFSDRFEQGFLPVAL
jgi:hypothetical protein